MERGEARGVALLRGHLGIVGLAHVAVAALLVAVRRHVEREELVHQLVVARVREAELEEGGGLQGLLGGLARLVVDARQLDEEAVVLHSLDHRLVHAHAVDAAADHLDDAGVAALEDLLHLALDGGVVVRYRRLVGDDRLAQLLLVDTEREGRAALQIKAEAQLFLRRIGDVDGEDGDYQKRQPFPYIVACGHVVFHLYLLLVLKK